MKRAIPLPALLLNVPEIAGKSSQHVARVLGRPSTTDRAPGQMSTSAKYRGGGVEVVFQDDKARRLIIHDAKGLEFGSSSLRKLGLPASKPTRRTESGALRWDRLCGVVEVTMFPGTHRPVSHIFVAVRPRNSVGTTRRTSRGFSILAAS